MHLFRGRYALVLRRSVAAASLAGTLAFGIPASGFAASQPPSAAQDQASAATATAAATIDSFDASNPAWYVASGPGSVSESGGTQLALSYNFGSSSQIQIAPLHTLPDLAGLPRNVCVDVKGDGSWNVIDLQLRDVTGEIFHYRIGNLATTSWQTMCVRPGTDKPAATIGGNKNGIPDLPMAAFRLILDKNPGGKASAGSVLFDNLRETYEPWQPLQSSASVFAPSAGQKTTLSLSLQEAASFAVTLTDGAGRTASWNGSSSGGAEATTTWNGRSSGGAVMTGSVQARVVIDRGGTTQTVVVPYLVGLTARVEPASPASIVGMNTFLNTIGTDRRATAETEASLMEAAYVRLTREEFDWNLIETRPGWFEWATSDQSVAVLQAHNISVIGKLVYTATWASSAPAGTAASAVAYYPPRNVADYAAYARAVVHRYKSSVHVWEIWNEENISTFWKPSPNATAYTALLKAAYTAIKAEDPTATVLVGGLAASDISFLSDIRVAGGWGYFDGVAIHTYVNGDPEVGIASQWLEETKAYVDSVGHKSIWVTELGWSTSSVSPQAQAEYLSRFYMMAAKSGVAGVCWYQFQARSSAGTFNDNYAVVNYDGTPRPAYTALATIGGALDQGSALGDADPNAATRVVVDATATSSGWSVSPLGAGSATLSTSTAVTHGSATSMVLNYSFGSTAQGAELKRNLTLPGRPTSVAVWVKGDGSANPVYMRLTDATGEVFEERVGSLMAGWQRLVMRLDGAGPGWSSSGGNGNGVVDYPLRFSSLLVFRGSVGHLTGTDYFGGVETETGTPVRGIAVSGRGGVEQLLYTLAAPVTQAVPVTTPSWKVVGTTVSVAAISNGTVTASLSALPVAFLSSPAAVPPKLYVYPDGTHSTSAMKWPSGDGYSYSLNVVDASGNVLTVLASKSPGAAGIATESWSGTIGGKLVHTGSYTLAMQLTGVDGRTTHLAVVVAVETGTGPSGATVPDQPTGLTATPGDGSATVSWTAPDDGGSLITAYTVTSIPDGKTCRTTGATQCTITGLRNGVAYQFTVTATNSVGTGPASSPSDPVTPAPVIYTTYTPISPVRLLDTRTGNGLAGKLSAGVPRSFQITGRSGIPDGATAVTGNVTITGASNGWALYLGPNPVSAPTTSTINFSAGQVTSNGLTVALGSSGSLSATYLSTAGNTTDLVFDVTGYFTASTSGATYHAVTPVRLLDTRSGNGLSGKFLANVPRTFAIAGRDGLPSNIVAVTGNVTVVNQTNAWAVYVGPTPTSAPQASTVNFTAGTVQANNVTVQLGSDGTLSATYMSTAGNTTDLVFDVTGYYTADSTGDRFVAISPARLLDTRTGLGLAGQLTASTPESFQVSGRGGVPGVAAAVTGNVTVTGQSDGWAVFVGPNEASNPGTSTLNFDWGEVKSNGLVVALSSTGCLYATYLSNAGNSTDLVFDVTGYFAP